MQLPPKRRELLTSVGARPSSGAETYLTDTVFQFVHLHWSNTAAPGDGRAPLKRPDYYLGARPSSGAETYLTDTVFQFVHHHWSNIAAPGDGRAPRALRQ